MPGLICALGFNTTHRDLALIRRIEDEEGNCRYSKCYVIKHSEVNGSYGRDGSLLKGPFI